MSDRHEPIQIPDRPAFKPAEVCELLKVQPYVLRSWENEFSDLGVAKTPGGPRTYRRVDVERAVRIRQLVFEEGLTLAGARRQLERERGVATPDPTALEDDAQVPALDPAARERLLKARHELRGLLAMLSDGNGVAARQPARHSPADRPPAGQTGAADDFHLEPPAPQAEAAPVAAEGAPRRPRKRKSDG
jgi:DNA-binding transcriptional MerR regulator